MTKFKKELYIKQRQNKSGMWSFQVRIDDLVKTFSEKECGSARTAYESAIAFRNKTLTQMFEGTFVGKNNKTVDDVFNDFLEANTLSYSTKNKHEKLYNKYISHKETMIQSLTKADILDDLNAMVSIASGDTINRVFSIWKHIINHALYKDYLARDLTAGMIVPKSRYVHSKRDTTTDRETLDRVEKLVLRSLQSRYNAQIIKYILETLYYTGLRPAEVEVLTRNDIRDGKIYVNKQLGSDTDNMDVATNCKTRTSERVVPIHPQLKPILEELTDYAMYDDLFVKEDGTYMNSTWIGNIIRRLCRKEGIEFNMYRLRHNMATNLVTNGVDTKTTMELLGHANYDMSLYYANSNDELKDEAIHLIH